MLTSFALAGIGMSHLLESLGQLTQIVATAPRRRIQEFADILWQAVARDITPTPIGLRVEINLALKTNYSQQNRTFVITLTLQPSGSDFMPQFVYGGGGVGPTSQYQTFQKAASVQQIEQTRALKAEMEAQKTMAIDSQEQTTMLEATPTIELHPDGLQQREQVLVRAEEAETTETERIAQLEERIRQMEQARDVVAHDQTTAQERELHDTQIAADLATTQENAQGAVQSAENRREETLEVGDEIRAGGPMDQLSMAPTAETQLGMSMEHEEKVSDTAELQQFNQIFQQHVTPHVQLQIIRQPMIMSGAQGDNIVLEVATNSFSDTQRINVNLPPVVKP